MMISYLVGRECIVKEFDSVKMVCVRKGSLFHHFLFNVVVTFGTEEVFLYFNLREKRAKHRIGRISFACVNNVWGGGVCYV